MAGQDFEEGLVGNTTEDLGFIWNRGLQKRYWSENIPCGWMGKVSVLGKVLNLCDRF